MTLGGTFGCSQQAQSALYDQQAAQCRHCPEREIADALRRELGVHIDPQALRIFIRTQWKLLSDCAHQIHSGR